MNTNNMDNTTTASSSVSQSDSTSVYNTKYQFDFSQKEDLHQLELLLKKNPYINDDILSLDDALVFEDMRTYIKIIPEVVYPNIYRWVNELNKLWKNWRLSKKKDKGKTFPEYIQRVEARLRSEKNKAEEADLISGLKVESKLVLESPSQGPNPGLASPKHKKLSEYHMEIGVKFKPGKKNWTNISSNLYIICQTYLPRDTEIKPIYEEKTNELFAVIITRTHKEKYDLTYLEQDMKRNIECVESLNIIEIKELKPDSISGS